MNKSFTLWVTMTRPCFNRFDYLYKWRLMNRYWIPEKEEIKYPRYY